MIKHLFIRTWLRGEALHGFDTISAHIEHTAKVHLKQTILSLGTYLFPINELYKKKCARNRGTRNPRELNSRRYAAFMIKIIEYLDNFLG